MDVEAPKRVKTGGRQKGSANVLPDLRAITLKALMRAGGVEYLTRQAIENPGPFLGLLGKVMPREATVELTGELRIRQEVRRDLVEKVIVLLRAPAENPAIEATARALPAIAHNPDTLLKAQRAAPRESLSRSTENARAEGSAITNGILQRATAMHMERSGRGYAEEAAERIDGRRRTQDVGKPSLSSRAHTREGADGSTAPGIT